MTLTRTTFRGDDVILTIGVTDARGQRLVGVFTDEADARSENADDLAVAIVTVDDLSPEQVEIATANSEAL